MACAPLTVFACDSRDPLHTSKLENFGVTIPGPRILGRSLCTIFIASSKEIVHQMRGRTSTTEVTVARPRHLKHLHDKLHLALLPSCLQQKRFAMALGGGVKWRLPRSYSFGLFLSLSLCCLFPEPAPNNPCRKCFDNKTLQKKSEHTAENKGSEAERRRLPLNVEKNCQISRGLILEMCMF